MNTVLLNTVNLDDGRIIKKGGSGGGGGNTPGGGGGNQTIQKGVNFRDYDGTILHSYTKEEFLALSQLPELPTHQGLICQEWNWSLEDAQEHVAGYGLCEIGATYITDDGKTRLYVNFTNKYNTKVYLQFQQTKAHGVIVDWGDGSATQTSYNTGQVKLDHTYENAGRYIISLEVIDGCTLKLGYGSNSQSIMGAVASSGNLAYLNVLTAVEIGRNAAFSDYAFHHSYSLTYVTIPNTITGIYPYTFDDCRSLKHITVPKSTTYLDSYAFRYCYSLTSIAIPKNVGTISQSAFSNCNKLTSFTLPEKITKIENYVFEACTFNSITIPKKVKTIGNSAFSGCSNLEHIVIPEGVTSIGKTAFRNCCFRSLPYLGTISTISDDMFRNCKWLISAIIPEGVTSIGSYAFADCIKLSSIIIPEGVTSIGTYAFSGCISSTSVTFPSTIVNIGSEAFGRTGGIADFRKCTSVPVLGSQYAFSSIKEIIVPDELYSEWVTATNWSSSSLSKKIIKASQFNE